MKKECPECAHHKRERLKDIALFVFILLVMFAIATIMYQKALVMEQTCTPAFIDVTVAESCETWCSPTRTWNFTTEEEAWFTGVPRDAASQS